MKLEISFVNFGDEDDRSNFPVGVLVRFGDATATVTTRMEKFQQFVVNEAEHIIFDAKNNRHVVSFGFERGAFLSLGEAVDEAKHFVQKER